MQHHSHQQRPTALRLILGGRSEADRTPISHIERIDLDQAARELRAEAVEIEAWYGPNAYSRYLMKHGRRPEPTDAATIGRLIGVQVRASDGSMQPRLSKAERQTRRQMRAQRIKMSEQHDQISQINHSVSVLATIGKDPSDLASEIYPHLNDSRFSTLVQGALTSLSRFAEGWTTRGKIDRTPKPA